MARRQILCHGDDQRFDSVADLISEEFGATVTFIADVAGGRGLLSRILRKRYNYKAEVVDPRPHVLIGVNHRQEYFDAHQSDYYDLVVGLHPDGALKALAVAALSRPTVVVPCCNFWARRRMGIGEILNDIESWYAEHGVSSRRIRLSFDGPYSCALVTRPPPAPPSRIRPPGPIDDAADEPDSPHRGSRRRLRTR